MKTRVSWISWVVCLIAGSLTGFALGFARFSKNRSHSTDKGASSARTTQRPVRPAALGREGAAIVEDGLQPFPPGFEGLSYEEICRKGPVSVRFVALLAWADQVPESRLAETTLRLLETIRIGSAESLFTLDALLARYGRTRPAAAVEAMLRADPSRRSAYGWPILLASITGSDLALAKQTTEKLGLLMRDGFSGMFTDFGIALGNAEDGDRTMSWVLNLPLRHRVTVLSAMMQSGRFSSTEAAEKLRPHLSFPDVRSSLLQRWALDDPTTGAEWTKTLDPDSRWGLTYMWAHRDPRAAVDWVTKNLVPAEQEREWPNLAASYAGRDPQSAGEWISQLPDGEAKSSALQSLLQTWREDGALTWVRSLPESDTKSMGLLISSQLSRNSGDFAQALTLAAEAPPAAAQRPERLREAWKDWNAEDQSAAQRWLQETTALTRQEKTTLQGLNTPGRKSP